MVVTKKRKALSTGRPPLAKKSKTPKSMSARTSNKIINTHHALQKAHALALKTGDIQKAKELETKIEENGGLETYQAASIQGQASTRGGDSSKVLVQWLQEDEILPLIPKPKRKEKSKQGFNKNPYVNQKGENDAAKPKYTCLEIGALSTSNSISQHPQNLAITRIDLHSQSPGILSQDFMKRPVPENATEKFDIISLSLVLNYVPDAGQRGEMLKRLSQFLRHRPQISRERNSNDLDGSIGEEEEETVLPALFLVLPLPCIENSRYLDEERLMAIMSSLGYVRRKRKISRKLCYFLFRWCGLEEAGAEKHGQKFPKKEILKGPGRNNFCVVVE